MTESGRAPSADRRALLSFLKEAGFASLPVSVPDSGPAAGEGEGGGTMVLLEPEASATNDLRRREKSVVVTVSTRARDRHGDVIDPNGVRLERFRKNPVVLYAHDYSGLPVAKSLWERVVTGCGGEGDRVELRAKPQFHLQTELSREVWALVEKGVLSAWSIGFIPEEWEPVRQRANRQGAKDAKDDHGGEGEQLCETRSPAVLGALGRDGFVVTKWDLLEYSCVPVPANFEALTNELKSRRITAPVLVKSLAPLGLEAPDLVEHDVRDGSATEGTESTEAERLDEPREVAKPSSSETSVSSVASDVAGSPCLRASMVDVQAAVHRAFEKVIARARGEGYV